MQKREIVEIRNDIRIISSNKLNVSQSKLLLMGALYEIILNKEIFPKKSDLKFFLNEHMNRCLKINIEYKEYLFASRRLLAARVQKEVYKLDYNSIINLLELLDLKLLQLISYNTDNNQNTKNIKVKEKDDAIDEWRNYFINKGK